MEYGRPEAGDADRQQQDPRKEPLRPGPAIPPHCGDKQRCDQQEGRQIAQDEAYNLSDHKLLAKQGWTRPDFAGIAAAGHRLLPYQPWNANSAAITSVLLHMCSPTVAAVQGRSA